MWYISLQLIVQALAFTFVVITFINSVRTPQMNMSEKIGFLLVYGISLIFGPLVGNIFTPIMLLFICIYFILQKKNILINISMFFLAYIVFVLLDNIMGIIIYTFGYDGTLLMSSPPSNIVLTLIFTIILILISFLFNKILQNIKKVNMSKELSIIVLINLFLCSIIFVFNIIMGEQIGYSSTTTFFNSVLFFLYFLVTSITLVTLFKSYIEKLELNSKMEAYEQLQDYTRKVENMYSELRSFKHDYANIMFSLYEYVENKDIDGLYNYYKNDIYPQSQEIINSQFDASRLMFILNSEIKSLIYSKAVYANEIGINFKIEVIEPVKINNISILDLTRILGIFLDNAIEASLETRQPQIFLSFINNGSAQVILITNTFIDHNLSVSKLNHLGVSSKGKNRGIGLYNVKQIVSNYPNILWEYEATNSIFTQHLEILDFPSQNMVL